MVTQAESGEAVDLPAGRKEKRKQTDEPCKAVTEKRVRKATYDPQGNEYATQKKSRHGGCL
jgi:hypothetical protein